MKLSKLASDIAESPTLALNEEARLLRERGEAVIHLGIGEPKNKTPINAILASAARLSSGEVKYTPADGMPSLKRRTTTGSSARRMSWSRTGQSNRCSISCIAY